MIWISLKSPLRRSIHQIIQTILPLRSDSGDSLKAPLLPDPPRSLRLFSIKNCMGLILMRYIVEFPARFVVRL